MENYDIDSVEGIDTLRDRMAKADTVEDWSFILSDYIQSGNNKVSKTTAIFNMGSAHDCPNRESDSCQVPWESCYAGRSERIFKDSLPYRRRQEYLWDCMTPELWADAFECLNGRKRNTFDSIRFSEAGDFRHNGDVVRVNEIAKRVSVPVYTYSASDYLKWGPADSFTVNASNDMFTEGVNRRFIAVPKEDELPDGAVWCPFDYYEGELEDRPKCGECRLCINPEGPDVAIPIH